MSNSYELRCSCHESVDESVCLQEDFIASEFRNELCNGHAAEHKMYTTLRQTSNELRVEAEVLHDMEWASVATALEEVAEHYESFAMRVASSPPTEPDARAGTALMGGLGVGFYRVWSSRAQSLLAHAAAADVSSDTTSEAANVVEVSDGQKVSLRTVCTTRSHVPGTPTLSGAEAKSVVDAASNEPHRSTSYWPALPYATNVLFSELFGGTATSTTAVPSHFAFVWTSDAAAPVFFEVCSVAATGSASPETSKVDPRQAAIAALIMCAREDGSADDNVDGDDSSIGAMEASAMTFERPFTKLPNGRHAVNVVSTALLNPAVCSMRVDRASMGRLHLHPGALLLRWLGRIAQFSRETHRLRKVGLLSRHTVEQCMWFTPGTMVYMLSTLARLRHQLVGVHGADADTAENADHADSNGNSAGGSTGDGSTDGVVSAEDTGAPLPTVGELFARTVPALAQYYDGLLARQGGGASLAVDALLTARRGGGDEDGGTGDEAATALAEAGMLLEDIQSDTGDAPEQEQVRACATTDCCAYLPACV